MSVLPDSTTKMLRVESNPNFWDEMIFLRFSRYRERLIKDQNVPTLFDHCKQERLLTKEEIAFFEKKLNATVDHLIQNDYMSFKDGRIDFEDDSSECYNNLSEIKLIMKGVL